MARVGDPLWILTRQWQFGEFQGADYGSPAFVESSFTLGTIDGWRADGEPTVPLTTAPLEYQSQSEPSKPDLSSKVELGQVFETLLAQRGVPQLIPDFRVAYPFPSSEDDSQIESADEESESFVSLCRGRVIDGFALYEVARVAPSSLPPNPPIVLDQRPAVLAALAEYVHWVDDLYPALGESDPLAWRPDRLEYQLETAVTLPNGTAAVLSASPDSQGLFDWCAFDVSIEAIDGARATMFPERVRRSVIPARVRFPGMPNARWWDFEASNTDFGAMAPDLRDVAKLVDMDFLLVHSNDWFILPFDQPLGTLCQIETLIVHDVFGGLTLVERADVDEDRSDVPWTMFSTTSASDGGVADFFVVAPTGGSAIQQGSTLEEVLFIRDEMANLAWAIERVTQNEVGEPRSGHERAMSAWPASDQNPSAQSAEDAPPLRYQLQTHVPLNWFPLVPIQADAGREEIALELGTMLTRELGETSPRGRILRPTGLASGRYQIREEEVPRSGLRILRSSYRCRGIDGATYLWQARRRVAGLGEGSSGLRFDLAVED